MTLEKDDLSDVTNLLAKTKVAQVNLISFKGKSLKLNTAADGKNACFYSYRTYFVGKKYSKKTILVNFFVESSMSKSFHI